jgi:predicted nucleic acid-binding protein
MSDVSLIDTNVIIYLLGDSDPVKRERAEQLVLAGLRDKSVCISQQVLQESLNVALRKLKFSVEDAERVLNRILLPLCKVLPRKALYREALKVQARYQYSFYDALIIAAALKLGCKTLYSEDLQHGQQIEQLRIVNPFVG